MLLEANRVLKKNGVLIIAEVKSRFVCKIPNADPIQKMSHGLAMFKRALKKIGFSALKEEEDLTRKMFLILKLKKIETITSIDVENLKSIFQFKKYLFKKR